MAVYTENLGLYLENDPTAKFKEWREKMNGTAESNMIIIDEAIAGKQSKITGTKGQLVGFNEGGEAVPLDADGLVGNVMYATFEIDPSTGVLSMITDDRYTGPSFRINGANLEVVLNG